jgi:hypothetical protein
LWKIEVSGKPMLLKKNYDDFDWTVFRGKNLNANHIILGERQNWESMSVLTKTWMECNILRLLIEMLYGTNAA